MALPVQDVSQLGIFRTKPLDDTDFFVYGWRRFFQTLELSRVNAPIYTFAGHAQRVTTNPLNVGTGTIYFETDRTTFYIANQTSWQYLSGVYQDLLSNLPIDLLATDAGFLFYATNFAHLLYWNGGNWQWAPGENGSGYIVTFVNPPSPATGWHLCDGSTVQTLTSAGTTVSTTLPVTAGAYFRQ